MPFAFKPLLLCFQNGVAMQVEKHIRKNKLTAGTFSEQVGASSHADNESTDREARKLAFFLYWNIKPTFTRYRSCCFLCWHDVNHHKQSHCCTITNLPIVIKLMQHDSHLFYMQPC